MTAFAHFKSALAAMPLILPACGSDDSGGATTPTLRPATRVADTHAPAASVATSSAVDSISDANGAAAREASLWVTSIDIDFRTYNQYKLSLSFQ